MAEDVNKQKEKREKYSRRRRHDPDADIDYINERNMKFNQKLERWVSAGLRPLHVDCWCVVVGRWWRSALQHK